MTNLKEVGYVVGKVTPSEIWLVSNTRAFHLDEYLRIESDTHDNPIVEVLESFTLSDVGNNTFPHETAIGLSIETLKSESRIKHTTDNPHLYFAKAKPLKEFSTPIHSLSKVYLPDYDDIEPLVFRTKPSKGFTLGVIKGTESLKEMIPTEYQNVAKLFEESKGVLDQSGIPFVLDYYKLKSYPHIGIFGGTGSGKTFGLRAIAEEIMKKQIPNLLFDPHHEMEFRKELAGGTSSSYYQNQYDIFYVGSNVGIRFEDMRREEFIGLFGFVGKLSQQMRGAIEAIYEEKDSIVTFRNRLARLIKIYEIKDENKSKGRWNQTVEELSESDELFYQRVKSKIPGLPTLTAISWRFESLVQTGIFESDIEEVKRTILARKTAVIRGSERKLNMIASYLIRKLYGQRRAFCDFGRQMKADNFQGKDIIDPFPPFFISMDESHTFAPNEGEGTPTKYILREVAQEARKYGVFLTMATQRPASLDVTIVSQLNTKFIFRTGNEVDIETIRAESNLNEAQLKRLPDLTSGNAFASSALLRKPFYIQFRATDTVSPHSENPFDELDSFNGVDETLKRFILNALPFNDFKIVDLVKQARRETNSNLSQDDFQEALDKLAIKNEIEKVEAPMGLGFEYKSK